MASKSGQRVRLVKCPKCLKILQEDEDVPVYQCGGCSAILQAKRRSVAPNTTPNAGETKRAPQASEPETNNVSSSSGSDTVLPSPTSRSYPNTTPNAGEAEGAPQASEPETNNVSSSSGPDTVLPSPTGCSSGQEDEKARSGSMESTEKQPSGLELSNGEEGNEIQQQEHSLGDSDKNEGEDNSSRLKFDMKSVAEATGPGTSSGSLNADHVVDARASTGPGTSSGNLNADHVVDARARAVPGTSSGSLNADHVVDARESNSSSDAYNQLDAEISPDSSPVEEEQDNEDYDFHPHRESTDDLPANKTSSAYDGSESSSGEREDQLLDETEQWNALQKIRSGKFEMQRYTENLKEQGGSSSSTFSEKRPNGTTTYQNRSLQLEGPGGRLGRQGRRHVTEQLRPDLPFYPREPYTRVSPSYPSHDEFDRYSRAHSLQMPPYAGGMNYESVDHMYHNNTRERGRGQGSRFSGEMTNHPGWYSGQLYSSYSSYSASPQRPMEQPHFYPRWSHEIVSDAEDYQRNRHAGNHHDLQTRRLKERQRVAKRHIRPTAGGAPFISCYSCSENLQLPVDFLIFKKKYHLLRCGTCTTVLRFSLQSRTHLIPAVTHDINANSSSNSTSESLRDNAPSNPEKPSSSAQEEEVPVARSSPLHRLMGYTTVSQIFKASQRPPSG